MTGRGIRRPSHATIVAYLALFIALATGVSWAASKITSSRQIAKNVIVGKHVKNNSLKGKDIKDGKLTGADVKDGSVGAADLGPNSVAAAKIADGSVTGADVTNKSLTGADISIGSLGFGKGYTATAPGTVPIDNGNGDGTPVPDTPTVHRGNLMTLDLPAGKYFISANALILSDANGAGVLCELEADGQKAYAGTDADDTPYVPVFVEYTFGEISPSMVVTLPSPKTVRLTCADDQTNAEASGMRIDAVSLVP